jgi:hypothetical protein
MHTIVKSIERETLGGSIAPERRENRADGRQYWRPPLFARTRVWSSFACARYPVRSQKPCTYFEARAGGQVNHRGLCCRLAHRNADP